MFDQPQKSNTKQMMHLLSSHNLTHLLLEPIYSQPWPYPPCRHFTVFLSKTVLMPGAIFGTCITPPGRSGICESGHIGPTSNLVKRSHATVGRQRVDYA